MKKENLPPTPLLNDEERDREIAYFESLSPEEIDARLLQANVKADEIVESVQKMVREKLEEWARRRSVHIAIAAQILLAAAVIGAIQRLRDITLASLSGPAAHQTRQVFWM